MKKILGCIIILIMIGGCNEKTSLEGVVIEEFSTTQIVESDVGLLGNFSLDVETKYGIVIKSRGKLYVVNVVDRWDELIFILEKAIDVGDKIKMNNVSLYGNGNIGRVWSSDIELIK